MKKTTSWWTEFNGGYAAGFTALAQEKEDERQREIDAALARRRCTPYRADWDVCLDPTGAEFDSLRGIA